ncbi:MAG TPA: VOC family protein [Streptosporangiaceae bacterium]|nr:VOC family protein [Streptosporangiaceae bacterium]
MPLESNGYMTLLFVEDIERSCDFYGRVLGLKFEHGNDNSASFILGPDAVLLLDNRGADQLLSAADVEHDIARRASSVIVTSVADVDALYEELRAKGVEFIRAPEDRWWGKRCAHFKDPDGHVWEIHTNQR